jgi:hypothetical protein
VAIDEVANERRSAAVDTAYKHWPHRHLKAVHDLGSADWKRAETFRLLPYSLRPLAGRRHQLDW